ncbi:S8 family serine peptidase [Streptomyces sp. NPDC088557]|uniref:S8 family serine peptidase n=1 Tax=Streptomyces sp. NPDC088557 TaxID=3365867 RepID=UPI003808C40B
MRSWWPPRATTPPRSGPTRSTPRSWWSTRPTGTGGPRPSPASARDALAAPGVDFLSTLPPYPTKETPKNTSGYGELSGTSMAAPYVSAVAALPHHQGLGPDALAATVRDTAANPGRLPELGLGNVDAAAAVKAAAAHQK